MMNLQKIGEKICQRFNEKEKAREKALILSREIIKLSGNAIKCVHRQEFPKAKEILRKADLALISLKIALKKERDIYHTGFVQDAQKEFAEAKITLNLIKELSLPDPDEIKVGYAPYLNGLGEAVGELRRHILDLIRQGKEKKAEKFLILLDEIYYFLRIFDYPEAITLGLRRTTDIVRSLVEKTRGDLTLALRQKKLQDVLNNLEIKRRKK